MAAPPSKRAHPASVRPPDAGRTFRIVALAALVLAAGASGFLTFQHFGGKIPGCGPAAGCAKLQNSVYSRVPGVGWPVAFVGLTYFFSMGAGLAGRRRWRGSVLRYVAWAGGVASLAFLGLMISLGEFCLYCSLAHGFNLAFVVHFELAVRSERMRRGTGAPEMQSGLWRGVGVFVAVFAVSSVGLGIVDGANKVRLASNAEIDRAASATEIIERNAQAANEQPVDRWGAKGFTGRYRKGPEEAALRIVVLTDYQCPDCRRVEAEIEEVLRARTDASLSVKHFPMCVDCNKYAGRTLHANACWAARAAEAAGILGGDEAFFKMHGWLFDNKGEFTSTAALEPGAKEAGLDVATLAALLQSPQTLKNVEADVEDGIALGLYATPMIFINGVEFKGWQVPGAFKKTVEQVAATNPPARTAAADRPVLAAQRYIDDWRDGRVLAAQADTVARRIGLAAGATPANGDPVVDVIVYGDYQEENTVRVDAQIREAIAKRPNVRYTFRHYPLDRACNPALPENLPAGAVRPLACLAARAVEAAGAIGGNEGYWRLHTWLMQNRTTLSDVTVRAAVKEFGWDVGAFEAAMAAPANLEAIAEDCNAAKRIGLTSIPYVVVNDKWVPRTSRSGDNVMGRIIEAASRK